MAEWIKICSKSDLPEAGHAKEVLVANKPYCVANLRGEITVLNGVCPHRGGPLGEGSIEGDKIVCPWHAWEFDIKTGKGGEGDDGVEVYPLRVEGDDVLVEV
jgi:nitrite reductase (NADH) small subunit